MEDRSLLHNHSNYRTGQSKLRTRKLVGYDFRRDTMTNAPLFVNCWGDEPSLSLQAEYTQTIYSLYINSLLDIIIK